MYSKQDIKYEQEANAFACLLLMPEGMFEDELNRLRNETNDEDKVLIELAHIFQVPLFSVGIRISMINKYTFLNG